jgi:hypothetical protein
MTAKTPSVVANATGRVFRKPDGAESWWMAPGAAHAAAAVFDADPTGFHIHMSARRLPPHTV